MKGSFIFLLLLTVFTDTTKGKNEKLSSGLLREMLSSPGMVVTAMVLSVINVRFSAGQQCTEAISVTEALDCNFLQSRSMCGWQSVSTSEVNHPWNIDNGLVARFLGNDPNNSKSRIQSQMICATDTDQYSLKFRYKMHYDNICRLTVFLTTKNGTTAEMWSNAARIDTLTWESVNISSPSLAFKLLFQAKKLTADRFCEIVLENTKFQPNGSPSTTPFSPTSDTDLPATAEGEEGGLSGGAIAGIIVGLIFVVALCVFVFLLIGRRNAGGDKQSGSLPHDANSTDTGGLETGTSHPENADIPESSNYYSMPLEEDCTPAGSQPPVVEYSNENSAGATISTVEPGSPYYINVSDRDPSRDYWTSLQPPDQDKNLYLSLGADASSTSTSKPGHGGRLEGNTSSTYLTPILDGGKCTEDASVGRTDPYENSSPKEAYVNTKAN